METTLMKNSERRAFRSIGLINDKNSIIQSLSKQILDLKLRETWNVIGLSSWKLG
jgi:hypothetical protein